MLSKNNLVLYEIYPRSFKDSTGNGYGDIPGIISKLDYLQDLGINAIWLTPFFPSPMKDGGYDITNYCGVSEEFGTLDDFRELIKESHKRSIQVVVELVVNHTSEEHPWFIESRSSKDNPKRDWYIWKDPVNGGPPNNWMSVFEPSPWTFDKKTGQYYFHSFLTEQPDLNWANPEVMVAVKDIMKYWIDLGVDGFRLDAVNYYWKDQRYLDEPADPEYQEGKIQPFYQLKHIYMRDQKEIFPIIDELGSYLAQFGDKFLVTEAYLNQKGIEAIPIYKEYYSSIKSKNVIPFNFEFIRIPWKAASYKAFVSAYLHALDPDELPTFVFGNHDKPRIATRIGADYAKAAAVLLLTLPGMPVIYYGDELGMEDVHIPRSKIHDTKEYTSPGFGRDPVRTPMQWDDTPGAGFTDGEPWLPFEDQYKVRNVATESKDPTSVYYIYKTLMHMRKSDPVMREGKYDDYDVQNAEVFAYLRTNTKKSLLVLINFSAKEQACKIAKKSRIVLSTEERKEDTAENTFILKPNEACILDWNRFDSR